MVWQDAMCQQPHMLQAGPALLPKRLLVIRSKAKEMDGVSVDLGDTFLVQVGQARARDTPWRSRIQILGGSRVGSLSAVWVLLQRPIGGDAPRQLGAFR
jgi:hypothetical protein